MKQLVQLEMKKINMKSMLIMGGASSGILFLYLIFSVLLMKGIPLEVENFLSILIAYNKVAFTVFVAVLLHKMFSEEIADRSFSILFTYPISRMKLLWTKILLIVLISLPMMLVSILIQFLLLMLMNGLIPFLQESLTAVMTLKFFLSAFIQSLLAVLTAFLPLYVDVKYASTQCTIITSGVMALFLYSIQPGRLFGGNILIMLVTAVLGLIVVRQSLNYIAQKDII